MSFAFEWPRFSDQFHRDAIKMLDTALNKGNKPPVIADRIEVVELEMGTQPPELEIRDIGDLTTEQFRGIFRFTYAGDAHLVLRTKVQANPLNHKQSEIHLMTGSRGMLAAKQGLVVPMLLRLSQFKLNSYVVLVVSKQKGITLVFKTDPLQHVDIHSTFDSIAVIQKFIQREIEKQLRQMFREDLPGIIHRLSQQWVKTKVETPYLSQNMRPPAPPPTPMSPTVPLSLSEHSLRRLTRQQSPTSRSSTRSGSSEYHPSHLSVSAVPLVDEIPASTSFPDLESFDPTYGLRETSGPQRGSFANLGKLFARSRGLGDLAEELDDVLDGSSEFDASVWDDSVSQAANGPIPPLSSAYETIPAIGGGVVSRPRVLHSQSQASTAALSVSGMSAPNSPLQRTLSSQSLNPSTFNRPALGLRMSSVLSNPYFPRVPSDLSNYTSLASPSSGLVLSASALLSPSALGPKHPRTSPPLPQPMLPTPPSSDVVPSKGTDNQRRISHKPSLPSLTTDDLGFPDLQLIQEPGPSRIVVRPALNNPVSKLSVLSHSNHTLSPFTRSVEHFAVRSGPRPSKPSVSQPERVPQKLRRKRIYRVGAKKPESQQARPPSPSRTDAGSDDMDHYFRYREDYSYSHRDR